MSKPLYMVSVPYTGTRFLRKLLDDNGLSPVEQIHTYVQAKWQHWFTDHRVVVPMRDPILHAITCVNLGRDHMTRLDHFDMLAGLATPNTHFFCVDTPNREAATRELMDFLGVDTLHIDWTPEGQTLDKYGWKARYLTTGEVPIPEWTDQIGWPARDLLRRLGYTMAWLEEPARV